MRNKARKRWLVSTAALMLLGCAATWADTRPVPDPIIDDSPSREFRILARKNLPADPILIPPPNVKPIAPIGGTSAFSGLSAVPVGNSATSGRTMKDRIDDSLKKAAEALR